MTITNISKLFAQFQVKSCKSSIYLNTLQIKIIISTCEPRQSHFKMMFVKPSQLKKKSDLVS